MVFKPKTGKFELLETRMLQQPGDDEPKEVEASAKYPAIVELPLMRTQRRKMPDGTIEKTQVPTGDKMLRRIIEE